MNKTTKYKKLDIKEMKKFFQRLRGENIFGRLGKTFCTTKNYYFLDTGTGKIAQINKNVYLVLKTLFEKDSFDEVLNLDLTEEQLEAAFCEIKESVEQENILQAPELKTLRGKFSVQPIEDILNNEVVSLTLEVTEKCNLRCKYCIYHPSHPDYREFGHRNMTFNTAKKAIDFLFSHSGKNKEIYIGFYGGEPLLNFDLIKKCVEYSKNKKDNKKISYSMTTNATLINEKIANFLAEHDFDVLVSFDGPEEIHNENRVYINGKGSFDNAIRGTKLLVGAFNKLNKRPKVGFNIVTSGPDYVKKYNEIQKFFNENKWLPEAMPVTCSTVESSPQESKYVLPQSEDEKEIMSNSVLPLKDWSANEKEKTQQWLFSDGVNNKDLLIIHNRLFLKEPAKEYGMNGCCVPGQRRVYVTIDGKFLPCEKVGSSPNIGDVDNGFNFDNIKKYYINDFIDEAKKYCKNCWAVNLCTCCYANCYDSKGLHYNYRHELCVVERQHLERTLSNYHQILENNPDKIMALNDVEVS